MSVDITAGCRVSVVAATLVDMAGWDDVTTFADLQELTPAQQHEHFRVSVVLDPSTLTAAEQDRLAQMRARLDARAADREARLRGQAS